MDIILMCPGCHGRVVFRASGPVSSRRLFGRCTACRSAFSLYGGRIEPVVVEPPPRAPRRWSFTSLVERRRREAQAADPSASEG